MATKRRDNGGDGGDTLEIDALLRSFGYVTPRALRVARQTLEAVGLTRSGKSGIAAYKRTAAERALAAALVRVCGDECARLAEGGPRKPVITSAVGCEVCGGSNNRRAARACGEVLRRNGVARMVVVGGNAAQQHELAALLQGVTVEAVDGTRAHTQKEALARMNRAQLVVVWGSTPLKHAVSDHYTTSPPAGVRVVTVPRRGIEALCHEVMRSYGARVGRPRGRR